MTCDVKKYNQPVGGMAIRWQITIVKTFEIDPLDWFEIVHLFQNSVIAASHLNKDSSYPN